jgi:hypothetical protein
LPAVPGGQEGFAKIVDVAKQGYEAGNVVHGEAGGCRKCPALCLPAACQGTFAYPELTL